jgi:type II restriction enzyme
MKNIIKKSEELVTSREQTRAGFISFALEKNRRSTPIIESAKALKVLASRAKTAKSLLKITEIRPAMLTAAGLSDKALNYFTEENKDKAILGLIENFLEPAGEHFVDEVVYRYLLIKGDSLGGSMRNIVGAIAQQKLVRTLLSNLSISGIDYQWLDNKTKKWETQSIDDFSIEEQLKALSWINAKGKNRILAFNLNIPIVKNNIDICLFRSDTNSYNNGNIVNEPKTILMLGELKGGIDPAGADEHWKTGNTALNRIRKSFADNNQKILTSFVAAAIEKKMASEIFAQLENKTLSYAANLTIDSQLVNYCDWLLKL